MPNLVHKHDLNVSVYTEGPSQGKTYVDDLHGRPISVIDHVEHDNFFKYITDLAKKVTK